MSSSESSKPSAILSSGESSQPAGSVQVALPPLRPGLHIVSTPIGNLRDITLRAIDTLSAADEVLAEDTRTARKLFETYAIKTRLTAYHDHNGAARRPELLERLEQGARIALISDAGTPLVSDPGWKLVHEAVATGVDVFPVPGASAMLAGLVKSGLPSDRFLFAGFLPPKSGARRKQLSALGEIGATLIFYESGPRLAASLVDMAEILGSSRTACVARELTKLFEEARTGDLKTLAEHYREQGKPKGEIVVMVGPPDAASRASEADILAALKQALQTQSTKAAAAEVAQAFDLPRREVYERALALKNDG